MDFRTANLEEGAWWRMVARLVAFAEIAEAAAYRSLPVRWLVLWFLRHGEAIVADLVYDAAGLPLPEPCDIASAGSAPEDALALAARFMALASMLAGLIRLTDWNHRWPAPRRVSSKRASRRFTGGWMRPLHDTS